MNDKDTEVMGISKELGGKTSSLYLEARLRVPTF